MEQKKTVAVVIPARNEAKSIVQVLNSLKNQTVLPKVVVVVDDGSRDTTPEVLKSYHSAQYHLIIKERPERIGGRSLVGTPEIANTFNKGFEEANKAQCDYILIIGADILLEPQYIEKMLLEFSRDPSLAIASGHTLRITANPSHARGAGRLIDSRFWKFYGGKYPPIYGWEDDCLMQCRRMGLKVKHFSHILYDTVRKPQGTIDFMNWGRAARAMRYHPVSAALRGIRFLLFQKYGLKNTVRFFAGYFVNPPREIISRTQRQNRDFMRRYQVRQIPEKISSILTRKLT
ncbi:MAG: glycosyltransferase family A protein [Candidatus Heimdallarchaeota archaeon]